MRHGGISVPHSEVNDRESNSRSKNKNDPASAKKFAVVGSIACHASVIPSIVFMLSMLLRACPNVIGCGLEMPSMLLFFRTQTITRTYTYTFFDLSLQPSQFLLHHTHFFSEILVVLIDDGDHLRCHDGYCLRGRRFVTIISNISEAVINMNEAVVVLIITIQIYQGMALT